MIGQSAQFHCIIRTPKQGLYDTVHPVMISVSLLSNRAEPFMHKSNSLEASLRFHYALIMETDSNIISKLWNKCMFLYNVLKAH